MTSDVAYCSVCKHREAQPGEDLCSYCDTQIPHEPAPPKMSVSDETLDAMVSTASRLTLGQMFKRAKKKGLLPPVQEYEQQFNKANN